MNTTVFSVWNKWWNVQLVLSSSILYHYLAAFPGRVSQSGVIDVGISDHQLIYCTRKTARIKSYWCKQIAFCSFKNCSPEVYEKALRKLNFPNNELFDNFDNLIQKMMVFTDNLALSKNKCINGTTQDWYDAEIIEK